MSDDDSLCVCAHMHGATLAHLCFEGETWERMFRQGNLVSSGLKHSDEKARGCMHAHAFTHLMTYVSWLVFNNQLLWEDFLICNITSFYSVNIPLWQISSHQHDVSDRGAEKRCLWLALTSPCKLAPEPL